MNTNKKCGGWLPSSTMSIKIFMNPTLQHESGTLFIITAPSGAGKTSLTKALIQTLTDAQIMVSYTTRTQRPGEENGIHYWFIDAVEFEQMINDQAFLEYAKVFDHYYGTSRKQVEACLLSGKDAFLTIDWQGATQLSALFPGVVSIYILPPSKELLQQRLEKRGQDSATTIQRRLAEVSREVSHYHHFDYLIINDQFPVALADLQAIVRANRLKQTRQAIKHKKLLMEFQLL